MSSRRGTRRSRDISMRFLHAPLRGLVKMTIPSPLAFFRRTQQIVRSFNLCSPSFLLHLGVKEPMRRYVFYAHKSEFIRTYYHVQETLSPLRGTFPFRDSKGCHLLPISLFSENTADRRSENLCSPRGFLLSGDKRARQGNVYFMHTKVNLYEHTITRNEISQIFFAPFRKFFQKFFSERG